MIRKIVINILLLFSFYTTGAEQTHHDFDARLKKAFDIDDLELKEFQTGKTTEQGPRLERAEIARKVGEQRDQKAFEKFCNGETFCLGDTCKFKVQNIIFCLLSSKNLDNLLWEEFNHESLKSQFLEYLDDEESCEENNMILKTLADDAAKNIDHQRRYLLRQSKTTIFKNPKDNIVIKYPEAFSYLTDLLSFTKDVSKTLEERESLRLTEKKSLKEPKSQRSQEQGKGKKKKKKKKKNK